MQSAHPKLKRYRDDIDGLRAIAVMLVVFNHLRFPYSSGGFIGVDVFFVISGYLIGSSMIEEFEAGKFSLISFYERRIRRIFPALLAMLLIVTALAYLLLLPSAFRAFAASMIAALFSTSNFLFWKQAGYFDAPSAAKPLLHTWSLAVEEQFYILLPLFLAIVFRLKRTQVRLAIVGVSVLSFAAAIWFVYKDSTAAFFWSPLRAWELLAGVWASQSTSRLLLKRGVREAVTIVGLLLILVPGITYSSFTLFPGLSALPPCLGAVLLLGAGQVGASFVGGLLSSKPFRFLGLISYSLYLWHWPILVFQNTSFLVSDTPAFYGRTKALLLGISIIVATLSWRFVEQPFRKGRLRPARSTLFTLAAAVTAVLVMVGGWITQAKGVPSRFSEEVLKLASFQDTSDPVIWRSGSCFITPPQSVASDFKPAQCLDPDPHRKNYLIFGDSTAAELYPAFVSVFPQFHFTQATTAGCIPVEDTAGASRSYGLFGKNCRDLWKYVHTSYLPRHRPDGIILAARWSNTDVSALAKEVASWKGTGLPVILVGPDIRFDMPLPELLIQSAQKKAKGSKASVDLGKHLVADRRVLDRKLEQLAIRDWHIGYVSRFEDLCRDQTEEVAKAQLETAGGCPVFTNAGEPLSFDEHHLTQSAALQFVKTIRERHQLLPSW